MANDDVAALLRRGIAQQRARQHKAAIQIFKRILKRGDASAAVYCRLGESYEGLRDLQSADAAYVKAIEREPYASEAYLRASDLAWRASALAARTGQAETAHALRRGAYQYLSSLGAHLARRGSWAEAEAAFRKAVAIEPAEWSAHVQLGRCLAQMYRLREAEQAIREGIRLAPRQAEAHHQLGIVLVRQGKASEAEAVLRQALALDPALVTARTELAEVLRMQGRVDAADAAYGDAAAVEPGAERGLYFLGPVYDGADPAQILERHRSWGDKLIAAARPTSAERALFSNQRDPGRRLRVGLVSPDFRTHSVSYFLEPLLACLDRDAVETYCYAEVFSPDDTTARLRALAAHWRPTIELDDEAFRNQVRADRVDILLDLAGHTGGNRLAAFAIRPAPVTAAWLGYPTTTGLATIDWRMTDATADPPGAEAHYVERLQRIDGAFLCFGPPGDAPDVGPLPALTAGRITFGTFNNLLKVTPVAVAAWAEILRALPGSRLLLKTLLLRDEQARQRWSRIFADFGVAPDRLELRGGTTDRAGHLASYAEVDIALDTFPYNGTATTCEALWAGVPVVALCGDRHSGRVGASLLGRAGLADLIQPDPQAYVRRAVRLAGDLPSLSVRRATLRGQLAASPLCDGPGFARAFGAGLRRMWGEWCRTGME